MPNDFIPTERYDLLIFILVFQSSCIFPEHFHTCLRSPSTFLSLAEQHACLFSSPSLFSSSLCIFLSLWMSSVFWKKVRRTNASTGIAVWCYTVQCSGEANMREEASNSCTSSVVWLFLEGRSNCIFTNIRMALGRSQRLVFW